MNRSAFALALVLCVAPACKRAATAPAPPAPAAAPAPTARAENRHHGQGAEEAGLAKARAHDPMVYVDGQVRAALRYNELPSTVKLLERPGAAGAATHHVRVCDYFHALGVDCAHIKQAHWYGAPGHVAVLTGAELRRFARTLTFSFRDDLAGPPRLDWSSAPKLASRERPDEVTDLALYVDMPLPRWDGARAAFVDEDGKAFIGIPYNHDDGRRGVRVNVDGVMAARIKRNLLEGNVNPVTPPKPGESARYRLTDFLAARNVALPEVRGVDLLLRDERVVRLSAAEVQAGVEFTALKQHHGEMIFHVAGRDVPALAVDVWAKTDPPSRPLRSASALGAVTADGGGQLHASAAPIQARR